jgi:transposase-like protein
MVSNLVFYQLMLIALVWVFLLLCWLEPSERAASCPTTPQTLPPPRKRSTGPKPFTGLTRKPYCEACEQAIEPHREPPVGPPPRIVSTRGRRRQVDTSHQFCPDPNCRYGGWIGLGNISANGHPSGGPWRQLYCSRCKGYFLETYGTLFHGKRVSPEKLVWAIAALAEGLGIRAVARVFEVDPNTVLGWLVEAAVHLQAFSRHFLYDLHVGQVQIDELFALLSAVKDGEITEAEALKRLSRSPSWVWVAMDPVSKLLLCVDVGERTLAMAQGVVHQVAQMLTPGCVPLFLTDGHKDYFAAILAHFGLWVHPEASPGHRPGPEAPLDAAAPVAVCASGQNRAPAAFGRGEAPCGLRHRGGRQPGAAAVWLADQHRVCRAPEPRPPTAYRGGRATGQHPVQGRGRLAAAAGGVPGVP